MSKQPPDKPPTEANQGYGAQQEIASRPEGNARNVQPDKEAYADAQQRESRKCNTAEDCDATDESLRSQMSEIYAGTTYEASTHAVRLEVDIEALVENRDATIESLKWQLRAKTLKLNLMRSNAAKQTQQTENSLNTMQQSLNAAEAESQISNEALAEKITQLSDAEEQLHAKEEKIRLLNHESVLESRTRSKELLLSRVQGRELNDIYTKLYDERIRSRELDGNVDELELQPRVVTKEKDELQSLLDHVSELADEYREELREEKKRGEMLAAALEANDIDVEVALRDMKNREIVPPSVSKVLTNDVFI
ncbi:hypothetical protein CC86DRAFT_435640 [Ophiobolus disseminans]|uniref:Uncharacterized protein n=1 Tax=Ophiobolus disseminans TaxID=1469910 RepID=A0A6A7AAG8_9PLEO|nr:hypothetical protein CC86DRAFT_435640 [Ophiobolus disseminans]